MGGVAAWTQLIWFTVNDRVEVKIEGEIKMVLQTGEQILGGNEADLLVTSHRIRMSWSSNGETHFQSIMLEEIASSYLGSKNNPLLLLLAAICAVLGVLFSTDRSYEGGPLVAGILAAGILVLFYFMTRKKVITFASAGDKMYVNVSRMSFQDAKEIINLVEDAKNERYIRRCSLREDSFSA
jgi:hypothetical protein